MINKILTDAEIKKALECCLSNDISNLNCTHCPNLQPNCMMVLYKYSLDLINRQEKQIEKLEKLEHFSIYDNANKCVHCGAVIPEGRLSCPSCEKE